VSLATPYSKNKRVVTVIDTDVGGGTGVGWVAMIEVVALMVGDIVQCYSQSEYKNPRPVETGMFLQCGYPKVSSGLEAVPRYYCFKGTAWNFPKISFATRLARTSRADTRRALADL
jgi:hypothetical protein